jgi:hypothetical protein
MIHRDIRTAITATAMVTEFPLRMQYRRPALGAPIDKFRPTKYAVVMLLKNVRKITAARAEAVLVFQLGFASQKHLGEPIGT